MRGAQMRFTYIGGPTALLEVSGLRLLTDPTFDSLQTRNIQRACTRCEKLLPPHSALSLSAA